ncbi:MAG: hypothetical protein HZB38_05665 [Planctomycetes bacterium]|nr:hypothetical protein [Planctomycetota bacterium]
MSVPFRQLREFLSPHGWELWKTRKSTEWIDGKLVAIHYRLFSKQGNADDDPLIVEVNEDGSVSEVVYERIREHFESGGN